jgi:[ribosomal protein S5]-alanine N-acetyltransferase
MEISRLRLIPIDRSGTPEGQTAYLPDAAREVCAVLDRLYDAVGFVPPWIVYLGMVDDQVIGTCAFKGPPSAGRVEIAYFTFAEFEGRGLATSMARQLLAVAASAGPEILVTAQTLPQESASTSVLKRLGFQFAGPVEHPEDGLVWEWHHRTHATEPGVAGDEPQASHP